MEDLVRLAVIFIIITLVVIFFILEVNRNAKECVQTGCSINNWATTGTTLLVIVVILILVYCVAASYIEQCGILLVTILLVLLVVWYISYNTSRNLELSRARRQAYVDGFTTAHNLFRTD